MIFKGASGLAWTLDSSFIKRGIKVLLLALRAKSGLLIFQVKTQTQAFLKIHSCSSHLPVTLLGKMSKGQAEELELDWL